MKKAESYGELAPKTAAFFGRGTATNCFFSPRELEEEINKEHLYYLEAPGSLFLLCRRESHWSTHFYLREEGTLPSFPPEPLVTELACRSRDLALQEAAERLQQGGFTLLCRRQRFKRPSEPMEGAGEGEFAREEDLEPAYGLLCRSFSSLTGCLPTKQELLSDIQARSLLLLRRQGQLVGILHFRRGKPAWEIRHLATRQDFRGQGLASALLGRLLTLPEKPACRVWVVDGNESARRVYEKKGFVSDGFYSLVLGKNIEKKE